VILDCPPTLSRLTEQVLEVADQVYVPPVPTWLSMNSWSQLHDFAKSKKLGVKKLRPFFFMVDRRKKLHQEWVKRGPELTANCLDVAIAYASVVERMGEEGQPQYLRLNPETTISDQRALTL
jgi:chromosome partitioning protein